MERYLDVGCLSNDVYAQHLGVTLYSLLENCSCSERIKVHVVDGGISNKNKQKLNSVVEKFKASITYLKPDLNLLKGVEISKRFGKETYYRFSLIETAKTDKLLSIDSDMVVKGDIKELFDLKFKDNIIFAVKDLDLPLTNRIKLGLKEDTPYFNSGLLLIDIKKWKNNKITEKAINWIRKNPHKTEFADQDGLNMALLNDWKEIDSSWNVLTKTFYYKNKPLTDNSYKNKEKIHKKIEPPNIIHYTGFLKPWFFLDPVPYKKEYINYLRKTPWKDYKFPDLNPGIAIIRMTKITKFIYEKFIKKRNLAVFYDILQGVIILKLSKPKKL